MKKISIKNVVQFRNMSDRAKKNFATAVKLDKIKEEVTESGGDYWVSCLSSISNSFKSNDLKFIIDKRHELEEKALESDYEKTQVMYRRNAAILYNYEDFDLKNWRPMKRLKLLKKHKENSVLLIRGLQVKVDPHHVFSFQKNGIEEVGAVWFIAKLNGFRNEELGMFADTLYRYLKTHFSKDYTVNSKYCIAVDVFNNIQTSYYELETGDVPIILNTTLDEIKKLM